MIRLIDFLGALLGLFLLSPFFIVIALAVKVSLGSPVLFKQQRPGLNGEPFQMFKFRTMTETCERNGTLLADVERLTPFGKFLRSSSLDELPELFNVLKGDMSLVGPRPLLMEYLSLYNKEQFRRHEVKPGITGWAQVNGRNAISWEDRFKLDVWYVENHSFFLDLKILYLTIKKVFARDGITAEGHATMTKFTGTKK